MLKSIALTVWLMLIALLAGTGPVSAVDSPYAAACQAGQDYEKAGKFAEARAEFEKALAVAGITPDQTGQALVKVGACLINENKVQAGVASIRKAQAIKEISNQTRIRANILFGETYLAYPWVLDQSRDAFAQSLELPEITPEQKTVARKGLVKAQMGLREFAEARAVMLILMADASLTPPEKLATQIAIGKTLMLDGKYPEARAELTKALTMEGVTDAHKADIQLQVGLSYYEEKDFERAKPELQKVLTMPGAGATPCREDGMGNFLPSLQREATLRLREMGPAGEKEKVITVLFVGSSMTMRGHMFQRVEELAASAPAGSPRIMSALYGRGGTKIDVFWNDGETRDTARGMIAALPWDVVVLETFCATKPEDLFRYGKLFADLARRRNIKLILYESPVYTQMAYPGAWRKFHDDNVTLGKTLNVPVAPAVLAEMNYLGPAPTAEQIGAISDGIHPVGNGGYLVEYSIYSTITGCSPVGLPHQGISDEDAKALQEAAWKAVQETNPGLMQR